MSRGRNITSVLLFLSVLLLFSGCGSESGLELISTGRKPVIEPDYTEVTIPPNIAPVNFRIGEPGNYFRVKATDGSGSFSIDVKSSDGIIQFPERSWKKLTAGSAGSRITFEVFASAKGSKTLEKFEPFHMNVPEEPVDPYLAYRLIYPGYFHTEVVIEPDPANGLEASSAAQCQHVRSIATARIHANTGNVGPVVLGEIREVLGLLLDL